MWKLKAALQDNIHFSKSLSELLKIRLLQVNSGWRILFHHLFVWKNYPLMTTRHNVKNAFQIHIEIFNHVYSKSP